VFFKKSKVKAAKGDSVDNEIIIKETFSKISQFMNILKEKHINLLTIGDDQFGATIQVRANKIIDNAEIDTWLARSVDKVKRVSWVQIEISGHDFDWDYRNKQFDMHDAAGSAFLDMCKTSTLHETPIHKLMLVLRLSQDTTTS